MVDRLLPCPDTMRDPFTRHLRPFFIYGGVNGASTSIECVCGLHAPPGFVACLGLSSRSRSVVFAPGRTRAPALAEAQIGPSARSISASDGSLMDPSAAQRAVRKIETNINAAPRSMSEKLACFRNGSQAQRRPESARAKPTPSVARTPLTTRASSTRAHRARSRLNRRAACASVKLSPGISRNSAHTRAQSSCSTGDLEDVARLAGIECMADSSHWIGTAATGAMAVPPV
jgi:hypothetical protein